MFQKESFRKNIKTNYDNDDKIKDVKVKYDINREVAKISALYSGQINKHELLTCEEILPIDQTRIIEQAKFSYSSLGQAFGKQTKTIKEQGRKQIEAIKEHGKKQLNLMRLLERKNKVYCLISKKKYLISLLWKELEKLKNYIKMLILKFGISF